MSTHTPGPQWYARQMVSGNWDIADEVSGKTIARTDEDANARLIAAAPELLEALQATLIPLVRLGDFIGNEDKGGVSGLGAFDRCAIIGQVRAAIAKAEGH